MKIILSIFVFIFFSPLFAQANTVHLNCENYLIGAGGIHTYVATDYASPDIHLIYEHQIENSLNSKVTLNIPLEKSQEFILQKTFSSNFFYRSELSESGKEQIEFNLATGHLTYKKYPSTDWFKYESKSGSTISNSHLNFYYRCKIFNP